MRNRRTRPVLAAASAALLLFGPAVIPAVAQSRHPASTPSAADGLSLLTDLFAERLLIADKVAAAKYGTGRPIDDPAREQKILDDVAARAVALGLNPDAAAAVFRDQIEANKLVQRGLYTRWDTDPDARPTQRPDLDKEVRPALDRITKQILNALVAAQDVRSSQSCELRLYGAAVWSAYGHELDNLHLKGLERALPSVCGRS
ncbi:chorismate mutase [Streptomyces violascens]|uniref:chorismate mutase n=1 Tax=Streptomyces violascens TaxID=67381 RepID=UPI0036BC2FAC